MYSHSSQISNSLRPNKCPWSSSSQLLSSPTTMGSPNSRRLRQSPRTNWLRSSGTWLTWKIWRRSLSLRSPSRKVARSRSPARIRKKKISCIHQRKNLITSRCTGPWTRISHLTTTSSRLLFRTTIWVSSHSFSRTIQAISTTLAPISPTIVPSSSQWTWA